MYWHVNLLRRKKENLTPTVLRNWSRSFRRMWLPAANHAALLVVTRLAYLQAVFVAPEGHFARLLPTFEAMVKSVQFK
jgi:hypothetical protein